MSCRATGGGLSSGSTGCGGACRIVRDKLRAGSRRAAEPPSRRTAEPPSRRAAEPPNRRTAEPPNRRAIEPLTLYRRVASLALRFGLSLIAGR
ncbi:hypothetical protein BOC35_24240 [Burkholderia pseudomallei]|nr:hypothetical protein BOC35_24240 [Burkholderia pseudomallei]